jgi:DNA-binding transcriptional LysR family regulator
MRKSEVVNPSNINFKLRQLALLSALAETGTLRAAAERINVSQPGATRLLRELEDMLGVSLFDRVRGRMVVTPAGETMIGHANALQSEMLLAYKHTQEAAAGNAGHIRIGIFGSLAPDLLSAALLEFRQRLPGVRITLTEAPQDLLVGALRRYEIDALVGRLFTIDGSTDLHYDMLYAESFSVVCGVQSELARRCESRPATLGEVIEQPWVLAEPGTALRQRIDACFVAAVGRTPSGSIESRSLLVHLALLASSDHVGVLASALARFLEQRGALRIAVPALDDIEGAVTFVTRHGTTVGPAVAAFRAALEKACASTRRARE